ncbi:EamA family transporter [bacterium]|nr:EamA family transporter [bacterium]
MSLNHYFRGVSLICLAALCWSSAGLLIKIIDLPPIQIALYRSFVAGVFLSVYVLYRKKRLHIPFRFTITRWSIITALCYVFTVSLFVIANKLTTSANAVFLQYTAPVYVILVTYFIFKEKVYTVEIATVFICLGGMILLFIEEEKSTALAGNIFGILSGIAFAFLQISIKKSEQSASVPMTSQSDITGIFNLAFGNAATVIVLGIAISAVYASSAGLNASPLFSIFGDGFSITSNDVVGLLLLGVFQLGLGYLFFAKGAKYISNVEIAIYTLLEPILNPMWTFLGTGEFPGFWAILGGGLVLSAIIVNTVFRKNGV